MLAWYFHASVNSPEWGRTRRKSRGTALALFPPPTSTAINLDSRPNVFSLLSWPPVRPLLCHTLVKCYVMTIHFG